MKFYNIKHVIIHHRLTLLRCFKGLFAIQFYKSCKQTTLIINLDQFNMTKTVKISCFQPFSFLFLDPSVTLN